MPVCIWVPEKSYGLHTAAALLNAIFPTYCYRYKPSLPNNTNPLDMSKPNKKLYFIKPLITLRAINKIRGCVFVYMCLIACKELCSAECFDLERI